MLRNRLEKQKKGYEVKLRNPLLLLVGMAGFEPAVSASRTQRSTKLSHIPSRNRSLGIFFKECKRNYLL